MMTTKPTASQPGEPQEFRRSFTDVCGRTWHCELSVGTLMRVKSTCGIDLMQLVDPESEAITKLSDLYTLAQVLWVILEPQADKQGITPEQFAEGLAGDALAAAVDALLEGMTAFFPDPARRRLLREYWSTMRQIDQQLLTVAETELASAQQQLGAIAGGGPAPAA